MRRGLRQRVQLADGTFRWVTLLAGGAILVILVLIVVTMTRKAWPTLQDMGLSLLHREALGPQRRTCTGRWRSSTAPCSRRSIAVLVAVPVSLGIALFITQVAPPWLRRPLVSLTDLVAVVPSVVFGLWGIIVLAPWLSGCYATIHGWFGGWPVLGRIFGPVAGGRTFLTAGDHPRHHDHADRHVARPAR